MTSKIADLLVKLQIDFDLFRVNQEQKSKNALFKDSLRSLVAMLYAEQLHYGFEFGNLELCEQDASTLLGLDNIYETLADYFVNVDHGYDLGDENMEDILADFLNTSRSEGEPM